MNSKYSAEELREVYAAGFPSYLWRNRDAILGALIYFGVRAAFEGRSAFSRIAVVVAIFMALGLFVLWLFWLDLEYRAKKLDE